VTRGGDPQAERRASIAPRSVAAILLRGVWEELARRRVDLRELERRSGVLLPQAQAGVVSLVASDLHALFAVAAELTGDPALGLSLGRVMNDASLHLVGPLILASSTLRHAIETMVRVAPQARGGLVPRFEEQDATARFGFPREAHPGAGGRVEAQLIAMLMVHFASRFRTEADLPLAVEFGFPAPADISPFQRAFPGPVRFDADGTYVCFAQDVLDRRRVGADEHLPQQLFQLVEAQLASIDEGLRWAERVRLVLRRRPVVRHVDPRELSRELCTTTRGLTRRLGLEGVTLSELLDELLYERARMLLARPQASTAQVAEALGYAELSSFYRAFRRWSDGLTPKEFLARQQTKDS
jgi:AraC-like DNA-binding protein